MSHEYYYQTVIREQEFLMSELENLRLEKERLEWELQAIKNDLFKVTGFIAKLEKELGDVSHG
jgi:predicted  nucleic acid-binding Zn-ribbon protein